MFFFFTGVSRGFLYSLPVRVVLLISTGLAAISILLYIAFQGQTLLIFARVARDAQKEAQQGRMNHSMPINDSALAARALASVVLLAASAGTTVLSNVGVVMFNIMYKSSPGMASFKRF